MAGPKFKVGQIVCTKGGKELPFRILDVIVNDLGVFYKWNRRNALDEKSIRGLTDDEKGQCLYALCPQVAISER